MRGVNKVIIIGNLGADPEVKQFQNGGNVTSISVATSEKWNDKQTGEPREATEWHRISLYNKLGEIAAQYLRKGSSVYIEGSLRTRKYQDQTGQDRYITEIRADQLQMLGGTGGMNGGQGGNGSYANNQPNYNQGGNNQGNNNQGGNQGYNPNYNQGGNQGYNNPGFNNSNSNAHSNGQNAGGQDYQPNNSFGSPQPNQSANPFIQNNPHNGNNTPTSSNAPQLDTPKPGVVDDDVPF